MTPEAKVKAEIKKVLIEYGCWYFMPSMNGYGRTGVPDFIGCYGGVFFAIEAKAKNGKVTPNQARELQALIDNGAQVTVATSGESVKTLFHAIDLQRREK